MLGSLELFLLGLPGEAIQKKVALAMAALQGNL